MIRLTCFVCCLSLIVLAFIFPCKVFANADTPELDDVNIVSDAGGSWDADTTPSPVAYNATVKLRAVLKVSGAPHTYYWNYSSDTVNGLSGGSSTVYEWDSDWDTPSITWKRIMPEMNNTEWSRSASNDPWNPTAYDAYTNRVGKDSAETNPCDCPHNHKYSFPGEDTVLWSSFGNCPGTCAVGGCVAHNPCSKYRGVYSRTNEGNGYDVIEYDHETITATWQFTESSSTTKGTRRYHISACTLDGTTKHTAGKEKSSNESNLVYDSTSDDWAYSRGIKTNVMRIVRKSNHSSNYVKHLESYYKVPWIYASSDNHNQPQDYVGFDCADLAVAAANHAGNSVSFTSANGLKTSRDARGSYGTLKMDGSTVKKADGSSVTIPIGTGDDDLHIGDLIMIDWTADGTYDHTTIIIKDDGDGNLDGDDDLLFAGHSGVSTKDLDGEITSSTPRFVLRKGW